MYMSDCFEKMRRNPLDFVAWQEHPRKACVYMRNHFDCQGKKSRFENVRWERRLGRSRRAHNWSDTNLRARQRVGEWSAIVVI